MIITYTNCSKTNKFRILSHSVLSYFYDAYDKHGTPQKRRLVGFRKGQAVCPLSSKN
jgi:hypothetical protein